MGRSAAKRSEALQSQAADRYSKMAQDLYSESTPQRRQVGDYYQNIISGGSGAMRVAAPEVSYLKRQFAGARRNVSDYMAPGGQKQRAYRDLAVQEPGAVASVFQKKIEDALARLSNLATGGTQGALEATGGVSTTASGLGQLAAARGAAVAGGVGGIANMVGLMAGMHGGGG